MRNYIKDLCVQAGDEEPDILADKLALLFEGAVVTSQVSQNPEDAKAAKDIARSLIAQIRMIWQYLKTFRRIQSHIHFGAINLFFCKSFITALITSLMI